MAALAMKRCNKSKSLILGKGSKARAATVLKKGSGPTKKKKTVDFVGYLRKSGQEEASNKKKGVANGLSISEQRR